MCSRKILPFPVPESGSSVACSSMVSQILDLQLTVLVRLFGETAKEPFIFSNRNISSPAAERCRVPLSTPISRLGIAESTGDSFAETASNAAEREKYSPCFFFLSCCCGSGKEKSGLSTTIFAISMFPSSRGSSFGYTLRVSRCICTVSGMERLTCCRDTAGTGRMNNSAF